ncbi:MAG: slipin family protein [Myxococcota bacterium]|nr:slipin family protein [Myxococcota bacterium]
MRLNVNIVSLIISFFTSVAFLAANIFVGPKLAIPIALVGGLFAYSPRMVNEWERSILLRLGQYRRTLKPGISWVIPFVDTIVADVDMRVRSTPFTAESALTKDTVPVNVDAVLFWVVTDAEKAVLEVEEFQSTVRWAAQTTLRDVIGRSEFTRMISDREQLDKELQATIDAKTSEWGVTVQSVEIRDVVIPAALEDAMSRKAQADREKEARIILAQAEKRVADEMQNAAETYANNPTAMQLRAMNMTYESIKEKGALMVIPSGMGHSIDPGVLGMALSSTQMKPEDDSLDVA